MKRRSLLRHLALLPLAPALALWPNAQPLKSRKPKRLRHGDTIGLITPGSYIDDAGLQKTVTNVEGLGFKVKLSKNIRAERGFNAGTDQQRLDDLHAMFSDDQVQGIWCARGGYGCSRLLPMIDYKLIKKNPKVFIGYSDVTALHQAFYKKVGLISFHGPVGASDFNEYTLRQFVAVVMEGRAPLTIPLAGANAGMSASESPAAMLFRGTARGTLAGGNISLLAALCGTDFELEPENKLLFLEEIGEKPYRIDRMLTQLRQSTRMEKAAGFALGIFNDCEADEGDRSLSLEATLRDQLLPYKKPTVYGLPFGHIQQMCTLPIGIEAELNADFKTLTLTESAVI